MHEKKTNATDHLLMLNCLLLSRTREGGAASQDAGQDAGHGGGQSAGDIHATEKSDARFNEEVEVYLSSLSKAFADPANIEHLTPYLFAYDIEVLERLAKSQDGAIRYLVLRGKDDVLLLAAAIFDEAGVSALPEGPPFKHGSQGQMGRGPAYFHFAFSFAKHVASANQATAIIEENLPPGLWKYSTILAYVTGEEFDFRERFADPEIYHLLRSAEKTCHRIRLEKMQDEFLDAYLSWRNSHSEEARLRVVALAGEIRKLDPSFSYTLE